MVNKASSAVHTGGNSTCLMANKISNQQHTAATIHMMRYNCNINAIDADGGAGTGGLLVDFPHCRATSTISSGSTMHSPSSLSRLSSSVVSANASTRSVRFTQMSYLIIIDTPDRDEARRRWYNHDDYDNFRYTMARDRYHLSRKLETSPATSEDVLMCVGMEKIFSQDINRRVKQKQAEHVNTILGEQERQDMQGIVDADALARLSLSSSEWTRRRARRHAKAYWDHFKATSAVARNKIKICFLAAV